MVRYILILVILFVLPIPFLNSQELKLRGVNGWEYAGAWGTTDTINTGMRIEEGPSPSDSVQRFNSYGWTTEPGGTGTGWALQNSFGKFQLKQAQYQWPDVILIDFKVISTTNTFLLVPIIGMLDTTKQGFLGSSYHSLANIIGWQTEKRIWGITRGNFVSMVAIDFALYSTDSNYVGLEIQVNNLKFVYNNGDTILVDPFQIEWPKPVGISDEKQNPKDFVLYQNYPNPFNPSTKIKFTVPVSGQVSLIVYNSLGQEIKTLISEEKNIGNYEVSFDASNLPSGIYFYRIQAGDFVETKKMLLLK